MILSDLSELLFKSEGLKSPLSVSLSHLFLLKKIFLFFLYFQNEFSTLQIDLLFCIFEELFFNLLLVLDSSFCLVVNSLENPSILILKDILIGLLNYIKSVLGPWIVSLIRMENFDVEIPPFFDSLIRGVEFYLENFEWIFPLFCQNSLDLIIGWFLLIIVTLSVYEWN